MSTIHPKQSRRRKGTAQWPSAQDQGRDTPGYPIPLAGYPTKSLSRKAVNSGPFKSWTLVISFPHLWVPESQTLGVFFHLFASFCPVSKKVTKCNKIKNNFIESKELTSGSTCIGLESTVSRWPSSTYRFKVARIDGAAKAHHKARERVQAKARIPLMFQKGQGVNHFCSLGETQNPIEGHTSFLGHLKLLCKFGRCQFHLGPINRPVSITIFIVSPPLTTTFTSGCFSQWAGDTAALNRQWQRVTIADCIR